MDAVLGAALVRDAHARLVGRVAVDPLALAAVDEERDLDDPRLQAAGALVDLDPHRHAAADRDAAEAGAQAQLGLRRARHDGRGAGAGGVGGISLKFCQPDQPPE